MKRKSALLDPKMAALDFRFLISGIPYPGQMVIRFDFYRPVAGYVRDINLVGEYGKSWVATCAFVDGGIRTVSSAESPNIFVFYSDESARNLFPGFYRETMNPCRPGFTIWGPGNRTRSTAAKRGLLISLITASCLIIFFTECLLYSRYHISPLAVVFFGIVQGYFGSKFIRLLIA